MKVSYNVYYYDTYNGKYCFALTAELLLRKSLPSFCESVICNFLFQNADRAQRRLVKNSFIVELSDGHRKLRHLFLFNDVIACAKYKVRFFKIRIDLVIYTGSKGPELFLGQR